MKNTLLVLLCLLCGVTYGQGVMGKRLTGSFFAGVSPRLPVIYSHLHELNGDINLYKGRHYFGYTSWSWNAELNYVLSKRLELSLGIHGGRQRGAYYAYERECRVSFINPQNPTPVPYRVVYNVDYTKMPLFYYGSDLSFKFYFLEGLRFEEAPCGLYFRMGLGVSRFNGNIDEAELRDNISVISVNQIHKTAANFSFPYTDAEFAAQIMGVDISPDNISQTAMHITYGFGDQRFFGKRMYAHLGFLGRVPFLKNEIRGKGGISTYLLQRDDALEVQWLKAVFGVGYLLK